MEIKGVRKVKKRKNTKLDGLPVARVRSAKFSMMRILPNTKKNASKKLLTIGRENLVKINS